MIIGPSSVGETTGDWGVAAGYGNDVLPKAMLAVPIVWP
jgi:hypothetical protein